jgi:uncharacterized protein
MAPGPSPFEGGRSGAEKEVQVRVAITGATGLVGGALSAFLREQGHQVTPVTRSLDSVGHGERAVVWNPGRGVIEAGGLEGHDVVIHLAGESIAGVWTQGKKRRIRESRVQGTTLLARTLAGLQDRPRVLVSASGVGIYGAHPPERPVDEETPPGSGFLADVGRVWEGSTAPASEAGIRVVHARLGNVLSPDGGMLATLLPVFRLGLAASFGSGRQMWPWIALADIPPAVMHILERPEMAGPVNLVAPDAVSNDEFTSTLARVLRRPALFSIPGFAARLAPGGMAEEILLSGARVLPKRLLDSGYPFRHPELEPALRAMLA